MRMEIKRGQIHPRIFQLDHFLDGKFRRTAFFGQNGGADEDGSIFFEPRQQLFVLVGEDHSVGGSAAIVDFHRGPVLPFAIRLSNDVGENTAERDGGIFFQFFQAIGEVGCEISNFIFVAVERMAGDIDAEHLFFAGELLLHGPIGQIGQRVLRFLFLCS